MMPSYGPVHKLIVHEVGDDDAPFHVNEFADYEIEHTAECESEDFHDESAESYGWYKCGVGQQREATGVRWSLSYSGTPVTEPGEYQIQAWSEKYSGFEYTEYDGGLALYEPES